MLRCYLYDAGVLQAAEEHAAELKQLTGHLSHAAGESRRLQLHNAELQEAADHYQADNARLKVLLQGTICPMTCRALPSGPCDCSGCLGLPSLRAFSSIPAGRLAPVCLCDCEQSALLLSNY